MIGLSKLHGDDGKPYCCPRDFSHTERASDSISNSISKIVAFCPYPTFHKPAQMSTYNRAINAAAPNIHQPRPRIWQPRHGPPCEGAFLRCQTLCRLTRLDSKTLGSKRKGSGSADTNASARLVRASPLTPTRSRHLDVQLHTPTRQRAGSAALPLFRHCLYILLCTLCLAAQTPLLFLPPLRCPLPLLCLLPSHIGSPDQLPPSWTRSLTQDPIRISP